jgi:hypothetical protein
MSQTTPGAAVSLDALGPELLDAIFDRADRLTLPLLACVCRAFYGAVASLRVPFGRDDLVATGSDLGAGAYITALVESNQPLSYGGSTMRLVHGCPSTCASALPLAATLRYCNGRTHAGAV